MTYWNKKLDILRNLEIIFLSKFFFQIFINFFPNNFIDCYELYFYLNLINFLLFFLNNKNELLYHLIIMNFNNIFIRYL
jgi:hypothetical protein